VLLLVVGNSANPFLSCALKGQGEVHVGLLLVPLVGDLEGVDSGDHVGGGDGVLVLHAEKGWKLVLLNLEVELTVLTSVDDDILVDEVVPRRWDDGRGVGISHDVAMF